MASSGLNFQNLTASNGALTDLKQLIFLSVLGVEKLGSLFNVLPNQKHGDKVGFVGEFGLVGKASQGCNPTYGTSVIATGEQTWDIKEWEIAEKICYKDLEGTLAKSAMRSKTSISDLTGTDYIDDVVYPRLELAIMKMLLRIAFFGDTAANTKSNGGVLKNTVDKGFFTLTDGFFKRIYTLVASDAKRHTAIAANNAETFAAQKAAIRAAGVATGIMDDLISDASAVLRQSAGQVIYMTMAMKDALDRDLKSNNKGSEAQWESLFAGIQKGTYNGIDVYAIPFLDEIIQAYECGKISGDSEVAWNKPYRAIYTVKDNLLVGLESESEVADIQIWFNQDEQMNKILAKDKVGTLIAQSDLIQAAY